jgi:hypothetical protein
MVDKSRIRLGYYRRHCHPQAECHDAVTIWAEPDSLTRAKPSDYIDEEWYEHLTLY